MLNAPSMNQTVRLKRWIKVDPGIPKTGTICGIHEDADGRTVYDVRLTEAYTVSGLWESDLLF